MPNIVGVFRLGLGLGPPQDDGHHAEHQDFGRVAAGFGGECADRRDPRRDHLGRRARHEHAFGVPGGELPSARRSAGLIQHRRALRRRLAEMNGIDPVVTALVPDAMDLGRIGEDAARPIAQHRIILPACFPQLVDHLHIFVGDIVAVVMRGLLVLAGTAGRAVEITGHHVPADSAFGQMVERRHPPRKRVGRLIGQVAGDAKAEVFGDGSHRRDQQQRLIRRRLGGVAQRRIRAAAEHVVDPEHVGEKQSVEPAALERPRQIGPVWQPVILAGAIARMGPQPRRLMRDAVHGEGVEPDLFFHESIRLGAGSTCGLMVFRPGRITQPMPPGREAAGVVQFDGSFTDNSPI